MPDPVSNMQAALNGAAPPPFDPQSVLARLDSVERENVELGHELLRCYEQLNLVFEITEYIATLQEPATIRETLLRRFGGLMHASAVFVAYDGKCESIGPFESEVKPADVPPAAVQSVLAADIELVLKTGRAHGATLTDEGRAQLSGSTALLGSLRHSEASWVIVVLRTGADAHFDSSDLLAADSVLGYGGHILNNVLMGRRLQQTAIETVRALVAAIDAKDNYTSGHSERVGWLARLVGEALQLPPAELQMLSWAGLLHDVGKIGVPEHILNKPGRLTNEEFDEIKKHPQKGYDVLKPVRHFWPVLDAVLYHHENHDGSGYPKGIAGAEIPLAARIVHVVDIFDALTTSRSYRQGFDLDRTLQILKQDSGRVTDPEITEKFISAFCRYISESPEDFGERFAHIALVTPTADTQPSEGGVA